MRNASGQQDENERQWEKKSEQEHKQPNLFLGTYNIFSIKRVTSKFQVATTMAEKCTKKCAAGAKFSIARFHVYEYMLLVKTPVIDVNAT